jgi:endonuclease YncB( thermonuclease family)
MTDKQAYEQAVNELFRNDEWRLWAVVAFKRTLISRWIQSKREVLGPEKLARELSETDLDNVRLYFYKSLGENAPQLLVNLVIAEQLVFLEQQEHLLKQVKNATGRQAELQDQQKIILGRMEKASKWQNALAIGAALLSLLLSGLAVYVSWASIRSSTQWQAEQIPALREISNRLPQPVTVHPVTRIIDGDTLEVWRDGTFETVRLLYVNTPERGQPGHEAATTALRNIVGRGPVRLTWENRLPTRDRRGRLLAVVHVGDTVANVELIRQGHSPFWTKCSTPEDPEPYATAEAEATD